MKKPLYLLVALLVPGLIFVFLKFAGKNEFDVPVLHEDGVTLPAECGYASADSTVLQKPYKVSPALRSMWKMDKEANVLVFPSRDLDVKKIRTALYDEIGADDIWLEDAYGLTADANGLQLAKKCELLLNDPYQSVLIDKEGRIRGYYNLLKREEVDKLRVEIKILLKRY